jgi:hypothetical protein
MEGKKMVQREPRARSELIADKEKNPDVFKKALRERWGFYRPVNTESAKELSDVLNLTIPSIQRYLKNKRRQTAEIDIQEEFGITFVKGKTVGRKMFRAIRAGFRMAHAIEDLSESARFVQEPLEVPLDWEKFAWYTNSERKAVSKFAESDGLDRLYEERDVIDSVLAEHGLEDVVSNPDHLTLFEYGRRRDNMPLSPTYKKEILRIIKNSFDDHGLDSILLDSLNVGPTYSEPCEPWEKACN